MHDHGNDNPYDFRTLERADAVVFRLSNDTRCPWHSTMCPPRCLQRAIRAKWEYVWKPHQRRLGSAAEEPPIIAWTVGARPRSSETATQTFYCASIDLIALFRRLRRDSRRVLALPMPANSIPLTPLRRSQLARCPKPVQRLTLQPSSS